MGGCGASEPGRLACTASTGSWNYVAVEQQNGFVTYYGHIKKGSALVKKNDIVVPGQAVGIIGSSGCSTAPHLHFEVHDCDNKWVEPANLGMWTAAPSSMEVSGILDVMLRVNNPFTAAYVTDPQPNPATIGDAQSLQVGFSAALRGGDDVTVKVVTNAGEVKRSSWDVTGRYAHYFVYFDAYVMPPGYSGPAYISVFVNGSLKAIRMIQVQ